MTPTCGPRKKPDHPKILQLHTNTIKLKRKKKKSVKKKKSKILSHLIYLSKGISWKNIDKAIFDVVYLALDNEGIKTAIDSQARGNS